MKHRVKRRAKWIQSTGIIERKGKLHRALGIPVDQKIPLTTLRRAAKEPGRLGRQARLAITLRGFKHRK